MRRAALAPLSLILLLAATPCRAGEAWERHRLGAASVSVLPGWTWTVDEDVLAATAPGEDAIRVRLERVDLTDVVLPGVGAPRSRAFAGWHLGQQRNVHPADLAMRVTRVAERTSCGTPVSWTWMARPSEYLDAQCEDFLDRTLFLHAVAGEAGYVLRVDVPRSRLDSDLPERIAATLVLATPGADPADLAALERVVDALATSPPRTRGEYRAWFQELELVGPLAEGRYRLLARDYVDGPGADDAAAHRWVGDRRFAHPLPEWVDFRGHPFLRTVEAADAKEWFAPDEEAAWQQAQAALDLAEAHVRRLARDRRYRAGDRAFANLAFDPLLENTTLTFLWADPFALVYVARGPTGGTAREVLAERAATLQHVYQAFLARYGERLDLKDLMAPWGGRPDYRPGVRSYPDGVPLAVLVLQDDRLLEQLAGYEEWARGQAAPRTRLDVGGRLLLRAGPRPGEVATAGVRQLLYWFTRQHSRWSAPREGTSAPVDGFAEYLASRVITPEGETPWVEENLERAADALVRRLGAYPVFPLRVLLGFSTPSQIADWAAREWSLPAEVVLELYQQQSYALARMLEGADDGAYRGPFLDFLGAALDRETSFGMAPAVFARAFRLRGDEDWDELDTRFRTWLQEAILGEDVPVAAAVGARPTPPDEIGIVIRHGVLESGASVTELLVTPTERPEGPLFGAEPEERTAVVVTLPPASGKDFYARLAALVAQLKEACGSWSGPAPVVLRHVPARGPYPRWEDMRLILVALIVTGHEDIAFDGPTLPEARALLEALRGAGKEERR